MKKNTSLLFVILTLLISCAEHDTSPKEKPLLFLPDDLQVTLWAESPLFYNPTNMDIDAKGRIWITEAVNYRNYNNDSSRTLHHAQGDRVMILEDTNGDGRADRSKLFVQDRDLVAPLGIGVIGNKVYVSCSPNLIVYTDTNGDDLPDEKEIFLTGFGGKDHDHSLHALIGGPDGKLYFNVGNAGPHIVTDKAGWTLRAGSLYTGGSPYNLTNHGNMKSDDGKVWVGGLAMRIGSDGKGLKVMGHNFRNAYELAIDSRGDMWQNDNDDQVLTCRATWLMEGGNAGYFSTDGTRFWQADQRPGQDIFSAHWHQDDPGVIPAGDNTGAGSPTGVALNEGDALGEQYRGMMLSADAGRNVIFAFHPHIKSSGYDLGKRINLITSLQKDNEEYVWNDDSINKQADKWFRPSDVSIGTDGAIYVADWYDPVVGGHQMKDSIGYGRIYRITKKGAATATPVIDYSTLDGQIEALKSPAINVRYVAFEKIKDRGEQAVPAVEKLLSEKNPYYQARAIWLLCELGAKGRAIVEHLLTHQDESIRAVALRALRQSGSDLVALAGKLSNDPSPFVRRELVIALGEIPYDQARPFLLQLIKNYDGEDRWYLEALGHALSGHEEDIYAELPRILNERDSSAAGWSNQYASLTWRLHPPSSANGLKTRASSSSVPEKERAKALTALSFINTTEAAKDMLALSKNDLKDVSDQAIYWLAFRHGNDWFKLLDWKKTGINPEQEKKLAEMKVRQSKILNEKMPPYERQSNTQAMARDSIGGQMILGMVTENKLPKELFPYVEKEIFNNPNPSVRVQAALYFKNPDANISYSIPAIIKMKGNRNSGEKIFSTTCASCHRVNQSGKDIGPELSAINKKFDRTQLLDAVIHPSAGIVFGYEAWTVNTKDGSSYFGFIVADGKQAVVIKDLTGQQHTVATESIRSRQKQEKSLMPEPASLKLTEQQLADISEYLMGIKKD